MGTFEDLSGRRFEKLKVIKRAKNGNSGETRWLCQCDCGNIKIVAARDLKSGHTKSCGCYKTKRLLASIKNCHGKRNTRLYTIWSNMKQRCYNKNIKAYKNYGARGIAVCQEWLDDFMNFYNWSMQNGYCDNLTLDRRNVNGNYEPSNCRWATYKEQANNKRNNVMLSYNGKTKTLGQWAEDVGMTYEALHSRIFNQKLSVETALNEPITKGGRRIWTSHN